MSPLKISALLLAMSAAIGLQGCGKEEHKKAASQVVAKVNGDEISVHQINYVLGRSQGITPENADKAKAEILDKLIDQQLAIQQAEASKLDRNPSVMQSLEAARRDILARAYLEQFAASQPKPTNEDAKAYYTAHPELFGQRRIYNLQELAAPTSALGEIQALIAQNKSMQDIANTLKQKDIKFGVNAGVRPAEQLPMMVVARLHPLKDGQTVAIEGPQGVMVTHIVSSQTQAVAEADALPRILQFLANQRNSEAVATHMKDLRAKAQIERLGEMAAAAPAAAPAPTTAPAAATPPATAPAAAPAASNPSAINDQNVAKGVAGLK